MHARLQSADRFGPNVATTQIGARKMKYLLGALATLIIVPALASQGDASASDTILDASRANTPGAAAEAGQARLEFCSHADLESDFDRERDDEWADTAEAVLYSHIAQAGNLLLVNLVVNCQANVCRARFAFPTEEYQREFGNALVADAIDSAPGFLDGFGEIVPGVEGSPTIEYYLMREGRCATRPVK